MDSFALLDDAHTGRATLLTDLRATVPITLETLDAALADGWAHGWHAFTWLPYDLGEAELASTLARPVRCSGSLSGFRRSRMAGWRPAQPG